jgi:thiol-disulfide isomerase/thioredoxin
MYLPDFTFTKNDISYDITGLKGKLILINLWATWCGPCKKEIPDLMRLYEEYREDNFEILGILVADKKENLEKFLENNYINYPVIYGNDEFIKAVSGALGTQINAIPFTIIAGEDGNIIETIVGSKTYEEFKIIINKHKNK